MAVGDLYEVILKGSLFGQTINNRFTYAVNGSFSDSASDLQSLFASEFETPLTGWAVDDLTYNEIEVTNLNNINEFGQFTISWQGDQGGEPMPPFVCASFRLNRASRALRNGQKRFAGLSEDLFEPPDGVDPTATSLLSTLPASLAKNLVSGGDPTTFYQPVISRREPGAAPIYTYIGITSAQFIRVSTQNSRKVGRGG